MTPHEETAFSGLDALIQPIPRRTPSAWLRDLRTRLRWRILTRLGATGPWGDPT